ncbi:MAG TPA: hypothetical protein VFP84_11855 [Kofleriaceae bacterium]|nr:hypothetical protein [Kofleriaceae bacterium]
MSQNAVNSPFPPNLNLALNATTSLTIGPSTQVSGDVAASGPKGSVLFDVGSSQGFFSGFNTLANTITVRTQAFAGTLFGNVLNIDGQVSGRNLGLDPSRLPQVPAGTPSTPGATALSVPAHQARQLCPGQYGAISLGQNAILNLNGGVYQVSKLSLADGARLEPSEPVVILIAGALTTTTGAVIVPSQQALNPMTAADIRIEVGTSATIGDNNQITAHLLVPNGKLATGTNVGLTGAAWAKTILYGSQGRVTSQGTFSLQAPSVPPPCNDNNACTTDACVSQSGAAFCTNTPVAAGTSCADGNACNGDEVCNATGTCEPGITLANGTSCSDGDVCNGDETCFAGQCRPGTPLPLDDDNACTTDSCDPTAGVSHVSLPDGATCNGVGTCEAGACDIPGALYSQDFVQFQSSPAQCTAWLDFTNNQLLAPSYSSVTVSGTFNPFGTTCTNPAAATQICQALHTGSFTNVFCDGHTWNTGSCGNGPEVSVDTFGVCFCQSFNVSTVRPCEGGDSWGGVLTTSCGAPSQNMQVLCQ